jgi:hypothetical protein
MSGKVFRRCHPRDVLTHALNLIHFEKLPLELNDAILARAFESCFVQEQEETVDTPAPPVPPMVPTISPAMALPSPADYGELHQA